MISGEPILPFSQIPIISGTGWRHKFKGVFPKKDNDIVRKTKNGKTS